MRGQRAEQSAERAGEQQGPGARVHALAGDVREDHLQHPPAGAGAVGDHEVAGEGLSAGRAQRHVGVPPLRQPGHPALHPEALAQVEQHRRAAPPGHADPAAELGQQQAADPGRADHQGGAGGDPVGVGLGMVAGDPLAGVDDRLGGQPERGERVQHHQRAGAQQQGGRQDRQDQGGGRGPGGPAHVEHDQQRYQQGQGAEHRPVGGAAAEPVDGGSAQPSADPAEPLAQPGRHGVGRRYGAGPRRSRLGRCARRSASHGDRPYPALPVGVDGRGGGDVPLARACQRVSADCGGRRPERQKAYGRGAYEPPGRRTRPARGRSDGARAAVRAVADHTANTR